MIYFAQLERGAIKIGTTENLDVSLSQFDDDKEQR
jgi:hypothetical protein